MHAIEKYLPSLFKHICSKYNLYGIKSIMWGRDNNKDSAKSSFTQHINKKIKNTGLWLHESGLLGTSLHGFVVGENAKIELKGSI